MMALSPDERKALDALLAKDKEDDDEDFEIEIWSGTDGARVPFKRGKAWFEKTFGVDLGSPSDDAGSKTPPARKRAGGKQDPAKADDDGGSVQEDSVLRHFGQRRAS